MLAVVTRVKSARVEVDDRIVGSIETGFLILLGIHRDDTEEDAAYLADRVCGLRIFEDTVGKMNISPKDAGASMLAVSQFTLFGDVSQRRPYFGDAARPGPASELFEYFCGLCREAGFEVQTGVFGADMQVYSQNDGPVTILIDSSGR